MTTASPGSIVTHAGDRSPKPLRARPRGKEWIMVRIETSDSDVPVYEVRTLATGAARPEAAT